MKRNRTDLLGILVLAIVTSLCGLILTTPTYAQSKPLKKLAGEWELSTQDDPNDKRLVTFLISAGQLTGTYTTEAGEKLPITGITFAHGRYSFRVSDTRLVFRDFKFVGNNLEGVKFLTTSAKGRSVPQVARMIRKSTR